MNAPRQTHPLSAIVLIVAVPLLVGCLLAPWIYHLLQAAALRFPPMAELAQERFERVGTRTVQVLALLMIWPCLRGSGSLARIGPGLAWSPERIRIFLRWAALGLASMTALYAAGLLTGAHYVDRDPRAAWDFIGHGLSFAVSALLIGLLEEIFFRGFVYGSLRQRWPVAPALLATSLFFAALHFMKPRLPAPVTDPDWASGYALLSHLFATFRPGLDWPFAVTLALMSAALCLFYERAGHIYGIAGLHAGWVWVLQMGDYVLDRNVAQPALWFGPGDVVSRGYLAIPVVALFALAAWRLPRGRRTTM